MGAEGREKRSCGADGGGKGREVGVEGRSRGGVEACCGGVEEGLLRGPSAAVSEAVSEGASVALGPWCFSSSSSSRIW